MSDIGEPRRIIEVEPLEKPDERPAPQETPTQPEPGTQPQIPIEEPEEVPA